MKKSIIPVVFIFLAISLCSCVSTAQSLIDEAQDTETLLSRIDEINREARSSANSNADRYYDTDYYYNAHTTPFGDLADSFNSLFTVDGSAYTSNSEYFIQKLTSLMIEELDNASTQGLSDVISIVVKYENYDGKGKDQVKKVITGTEWKNACDETLKKAINSVSKEIDYFKLTDNLNLNETLSVKKYAPIPDEVIGEKIDAVLTNCTSLSDLSEIKKSLFDTYRVAIESSKSYQDKANSLIITSVKECSSLSELRQLKNTVLNNFGQNIEDTVPFIEVLDTLFSSEIKSTYTVARISFLKTNVFWNTASSLPLTSEAFANLCLNEQLDTDINDQISSCSSLSQLIQKRKEITEIVGFSLEEKEYYQNKLNGYLSSFDSFSELEQIDDSIISEISENDGFFSALQRLVKKEISRYLNLQEAHFSELPFEQIKTIDDGKVIISSLSFIRSCFNNLGAAKTVSEINTIASKYSKEKSTSFFDSSFEVFKSKQLITVSAIEREQTAYNSLKARLQNEGLIDDILQGLINYLSTYDEKSSVWYDKNHFSTIEAVYSLIKGRQDWTKSSKFSSLFQNLATGIPSLPLYIGHRGKSYENTGITLTDFLSSQDFSDWTVIITDNSNWTSKQYILDMRYSSIFGGVNYSFTLEKKGDTLVIVSVSSPSDKVYSSEDYSVIRKYYENIVEEYDAKLWLYLLYN